MPLHDWQFWIVSAFALWGLYVLARPFMPRRKGTPSSGACPNCSSGSAAAKPRRVALTIDHKRID